MNAVGSFRPACNGACLISHCQGDLIPVTYCLVGKSSSFVVYF